ncbi:carboxylate--amine ligase [Halorussus gelatinilyticus]|uniref:Carboxylate--amine ligase n=1 Tax=Halorussus gelatinilyticus TaxID=2937524 RepID=A0A8U0IJL5_9EURY|nr:carboxylate--amine ligase [Halorussus gelatinilyticus]UPW00482.1 carboxylate--amine ligase [Halorussus gelatinilyticus]
MATFRSFEGLRDALADAEFDRPPAIVCNAHITGLSVARALQARDVPVIAIDRNEKGVAPYSDAVDFAGRVTYPLDDEAGFCEDVEALAAELDHEPVAFGCMDEWVHAFSRTEPEGVVLPFAERATIDRVLDKESLYTVAEELGVPYPETYRIAETDPTETGGEQGPAGREGGPGGEGRESIPAAEAAERLGFPLVVKPALKRKFAEAVGTNVIEVADEAEFEDVVANAAAEGVRVMAQEKVPAVQGEDCSLASYVPESGDAVSFVGNARVRYPLGYGTSCVVRRATGEDAREVEENALAVLDETGYYGISEAEFLYDGDREQYALIDVNTRPWKWISLPVQAGANLPLAAYSDAVGEDYEADEVRDASWVYLADYLKALGTEGFADVLSRDDWLSLMSGDFEASADLTTGVYRPSDPAPAYQLLTTEFGTQEYYCSC